MGPVASLADIFAFYGSHQLQIAMRERYVEWYTPRMSRRFQMLVFGHAGMPLIAFPTVRGEFHQNKDFLLIESIRWFIEQGLVMVYCPDSSDGASWYNRGIHPADRVRTHQAYERIIMEEVVPMAQHETGHHKVSWTGCSFGGYHAANCAFRYPHLTRYLIGMSAAFDLRSFMQGYHNEDFYFNNPVDYVGGAQEGHHLHQLRGLGIILGCGEHDNCREDNFNFSALLHQKGIRHWLDYRPGQYHDWPMWRDMLPFYLSKLALP